MHKSAGYGFNLDPVRIHNTAWTPLRRQSWLVWLGKSDQNKILKKFDLGVPPTSLTTLLEMK